LIQQGLAGAFLTVFATIFVSELTDKDAMLLLSFATTARAQYAFLAGSIAFTITTAIIVTVGSVLVRFVPIFWVKVAGGAIMLGYAAWEYSQGRRRAGGGAGSGGGGREDKLLKGWRKNELRGFLLVILSLIILDLAGDATELITIVFVAQFNDALLVFAGAVLALVAAAALETVLGRTLGKLLSAKRIRDLSIVVFLAIGAIILLTTVIPSV
jgi:putative Ca2+/H+ antiporter (TMEM165/GDT1 family)